MAIRVNCSECGQELDEPGALLIGPPNEDNVSRKEHICQKCYYEPAPTLPQDTIDQIRLALAKQYMDTLLEFEDFVGVTTTRDELDGRLTAQRVLATAPESKIAELEELAKRLVNAEMKANVPESAQRDVEVDTEPESEPASSLRASYARLAAHGQQPPETETPNETFWNGKPAGTIVRCTNPHHDRDWSEPGDVHPCAVCNGLLPGLIQKQEDGTWVPVEEGTPENPTHVEEG